MIYTDVIVTSSVGLHARPATTFILKANEFKSSVWVESNERRANAKSLLGIISLNVQAGTAIKIYADGVDEEATVYGLISLIENNFEEDL